MILIPSIWKRTIWSHYPTPISSLHREQVMRVFSYFSLTFIPFRFGAVGLCLSAQRCIKRAKRYQSRSIFLSWSGVTSKMYPSTGVPEDALSDWISNRNFTLTKVSVTPKSNEKLEQFKSYLRQLYWWFFVGPLLTLLWLLKRKLLRGLCQPQRPAEPEFNFQNIYIKGGNQIKTRIL